MISSDFFLKCLVDRGIDFFSGVPDSLLKNFCFYMTDNINSKNHIVAANEGNALALGIGYHLATKKIPLIYMQNSGLGNVINPLLSLADPDVYSIPILLLIGLRGELNSKDEPQHKKQGRVTLAMLEAMEVPYEIISSDTDNKEAQKIVNKSIEYCRMNNAPHAIIVKKNTFSEHKPKKNEIVNLPLFREAALKIVVDHLNGDDIVVATTGVTSRELYEYRESLNQGHEKDFLAVGGMGHANQIALGIAMQKPNRQVFCLDGDGAMLMHMGSVAINGSVGCKNYKHILFNNGAHDSVGGQPTAGYKINFRSIAGACGYSLILRAKTTGEVAACIIKMKEFKGTSFLEILVKKGFRENLGRPTTQPKNNKKNIIKFIKDSYYD
jgi:phosphonopyruvate decarboxylase